jgi:hypothetical protein
VSGEEADLPVVDAREVVRQYRDQLALYLELPPLPPEDADTGEQQPPPERGVALEELPDSLRQLVADYERTHPDVRLVPLAVLRSGQAEQQALAAGSLVELPDEDSIVCFSVTETTLSAESAQVRTHTLVASLAPADAGPKSR